MDLQCVRGARGRSGGAVVADLGGFQRESASHKAFAVWNGVSYHSRMASTDPTELMAKALQLPTAARLELADQLLASVEEPEDEEWAAAWATELKRRVDAYESGNVESIPANEALARVRARLANR